MKILEIKNDLPKTKPIKEIMSALYQILIQIYQIEMELFMQ